MDPVQLRPARQAEALNLSLLNLPPRAHLVHPLPWGNYRTMRNPGPEGTNWNNPRIGDAEPGRAPHVARGGSGEDEAGVFKLADWSNLLRWFYWTSVGMKRHHFRREG